MTVLRFLKPRFETGPQRFMSLLLIVGVPFFVGRCLLRSAQIQKDPLQMLAIAAREVIETVVLWVANELFVRAGRNRRR
jgi:hypothetical protein